MIRHAHHQRNLPRLCVKPTRMHPARVATASPPPSFHSVFDLAKAKSPDLDAFDRIFDVYACEASCSVGEMLSQKYDVPTDNRQFVMSLSNRFSHEQTWFNAERRKKPQITTENGSVQDPTQNGASCDFCDPYRFTASDDFGRIETPRVVSASNLFKYCAPGHGLLVFRHHHPLEFDSATVHDLMQCTQEWIKKASKQHPTALYPLLIWNCLERSGGSQFHGHAQIMLSEVPLPCYQRLKAAQESYASSYGDKSYLVTLFEAYREVGLLETFGNASETCVVYPSLTPWKDMEVVLWSSSLTTPAFCCALSLVLKTLMEKFGMQSFNVGIQGMSLHYTPPSWPEPSEVGGVMARVVSRGKMTSRASDFGGMEVFGGASIGHTDPFEIKRVIHEDFLQSQERTDI